MGLHVRRSLGQAALLAAAAAMAVGCGSSSEPSGTATRPPATSPAGGTVNAAAQVGALTHRQLLRRVNRLCAEQAATMAPLLRSLNAPGVRSNSAELIAGVMGAARTLEFGLNRLQPSARDAAAFRRYRRDVTRFNALNEQLAAVQDRASVPSAAPDQQALDTLDDTGLVEQADAVILGVHGCTPLETRVVMRRRYTG